MAGSLTLALAQQFDEVGVPLSGALLYFYVVGTVATPQNSFEDIGLTLLNPWPLQADDSGRIPNFYLADGQVHVRLTDADGVVVFESQSMQVLGPSSGGGGGGGTVDPTSIMSTGDFKWRPTSEVVTGWVKANALTIGAAASGASQRANADCQSLYVYLWNNFPDSHCPVFGGRGANGLSDFAANKTIVLPDLRGRSPFGVDDMGNAASGRILASNVTSAGDTVSTPAATGGEANHTLGLAEVPAGQFTMTDPGHAHHPNVASFFLTTNGPGIGLQGGSNLTYAESNSMTTETTGITITDHAGGQSHNNMPNFMLGSWYIKL